MRRITTVFAILLLITGCSFSKAYTDAIEETEEHLNNEAFDKALETIQIALNEKENDDVALNIESGLLKYQTLKKQEEKRKWEEVSDTIDSFGTLDSVHPKLKKQIDKINREMIKQVNLEKELDEDLVEINADLNNESFDEAEELIEKLETNEAFTFAEKEIQSIREEYETKFKAFKKEEKKLKRKRELASIHSTFKEKITKIEKDEKQLKEKNDGEQSIEVLSDIEEAYDDVLNEVYQKIIKEFPKKEDDLRSVQREWLVVYEEEIYQVRYRSGNVKAVEYSIKSKKARTNELLNKFFK